MSQNTLLLFFTDLNNAFRIITIWQITVAFGVAQTFLILHLTRRNKRLKTDQQLIQNSLHLLQRQMNQHFIFNCLNTINYYLLLDNNKRASDLLSKFAKLIRFFLEASEKPANTVLRECQLLRLYLELEQTRFQDLFSFTVELSSEVERLEIPSMIVYPIVESAINSNACTPDTKCEINIQFNRKTHVCCSVSTNGLATVDEDSISPSIHRLKLLRPKAHIFFDRIADTSDKTRNCVSIEFIE